MIFAIWILAISSSLLLAMSALAFLKARDVFTMTHAVMICNCYIIPMILMSIELERFSWLSFSKIIALIILNLIVVNLLCQAILRRAVINKIIPDADYRKN